MRVFRIGAVIKLLFSLGWEGFRCEACIPLPGCENGHCQNEAFECICDEPDLWTGDHCDERKAQKDDLCYKI